MSEKRCKGLRGVPVPAALTYAPERRISSHLVHRTFFEAAYNNSSSWKKSYSYSLPCRIGKKTTLIAETQFAHLDIHQNHDSSSFPTANPLGFDLPTRGVAHELELVYVDPPVLTRVQGCCMRGYGVTHPLSGDKWPFIDVHHWSLIIGGSSGSGAAMLKIEISLSITYRIR